MRAVHSCKSWFSIISGHTVHVYRVKIETEIVLSLDVAVILWITSCHKNRMTTRVITRWHVHVTSMTTAVSLRFLIEIMSILKVIKSHFKGHVINRILHSRSLYMKFMKLAEGSFHKFHMKWPLV